jgi:hypothetical protein
MKTRIFIAIVCVVSAQIRVVTQSRPTKTPRPIRAVSLRQVGRYANQYVPGMLKLSRVVLEGVKHVDNDWVYVFHLRDPETGLQRGEELTIQTYKFLICTDEEIGKPLLKNRVEWLGHRVNVYLIITDRGLTPNIYVGYVRKIELLNDRGQVLKAFPTERLSSMLQPNKRLQRTRLIKSIIER